MHACFVSVRGAAGRLLALALALLLAPGAVGIALAEEASAPATANETVREEVGRPLQAAQQLMKEKKFKEALARIHEAEAVANRTAYENYVIDRMRGSAAANSGDDELAVTSFESVVASGRLSPTEQLRVIQAIADTYFKLKNYTKAAEWAARYLKEGGADPSMQDVLIDSHYLNKDFATAASELKALVDADERAGRATSEVHLQLLLDCYQKLGNSTGSAAVLEKLLALYPKKEYWQLAISHVVHRAGFADRLELDVLRLQLALGELRRDSDYMTMGQLALEAGYPAEAKKVVDQGFAAGILGKGPEAERHRRLQNKVNKDAADDLKALGQGDAGAEKAATGDALVNTGYNYVLNGKYERGLSLMEQGLHKGALKHPEEAKLHLGLAYSLAGDRAQALQMLRTVQGSDGAADLAHLWALYIGGKG